MSEERSPEQKAKDLRDAVRAVENKTIDVMPWYQAEALAEALAAKQARIEEIETSSNAINRLRAVISEWIVKHKAQSEEIAALKAGLVNPELHWRKQWEIQATMKDKAESKAAALRDEVDRLKAEKDYDPNVALVAERDALLERVKEFEAAHKRVAEILGADPTKWESDMTKALSVKLRDTEAKLDNGSIAAIPSADSYRRTRSRSNDV